MDRVLHNTNILLDIVLKRLPDFNDATRLLFD